MLSGSTWEAEEPAAIPVGPPEEMDWGAGLGGFLRFALKKCFIRVIERRDELSTNPLSNLLPINM